MRRAFLREQPHQHRGAHQANGSTDQPQRAPVQYRHQCHKDQWQEGLPERNAKGRNRQRPSARGNKPSRHGDDRQMGAHALTKEPQREYRQRQDPVVVIERHQHAGCRQPTEHEGTELTHPQNVREATRRHHQQSRGRGSHHIKPAPARMAQTKLRLDLPGKDRDEKGLPKARKKGQQHTCRKIGRVVEKKFVESDGFGHAHMLDLLRIARKGERYHRDASRRCRVIFVAARGEGSEGREENFPMLGLNLSNNDR